MSSETAAAASIDPKLTDGIYLLDQQWCPVIIDDSLEPRLAPRYRYLEEHTKQTILTLWSMGHEAASHALATCSKQGSVYKYCKKKNRARAHRHTCHEWICNYCGKPENMLHCWLRTRRYEVRSERQYGIEIRGPLGTDLAPIVAQLMRWLKSTRRPSVARKIVDPHPKFNGVRMVVHADHSPFRDIATKLHEITGHALGYCAQPNYQSSPTVTLRWMFASTAPILEACGHTRARAWDMHYRKRLLTTAGEFYAPVKDQRSLDAPAPDEEFSEVKEQSADDNRCDCGECDGEMTIVPWGERRVQSVEAIEEEFKHVDWSSCYDPFHSGRIKSKGPLRLNSTTVPPNYPVTAQPTASPPS